MRYADPSRLACACRPANLIARGCPTVPCLGAGQGPSLLPISYLIIIAKRQAKLALPPTTTLINSQFPTLLLPHTITNTQNTSHLHEFRSHSLRTLYLPIRSPVSPPEERNKLRSTLLPRIFLQQLPLLRTSGCSRPHPSPTSTTALQHVSTI